MGTKRGGRRRHRGGGKKAEGEDTTAKKNVEANRVANNDNPKENVRVYFKVFASFKCSNDRCNKNWHSAHAWEREDDEGGIDCEVCSKPAELMNAVDEMLKLDTYICPTPNCFNRWQSIHVDDNSKKPQECDICLVKVFPGGPPQERFGRHYWLQCVNEECPEKKKVEWEDFSLNEQKTQRCTKCYSRGDIIRVQKLKQLPPWLWKRRLGRGRGGANGEPDMEEKPSNHVTEFCDMCQDIIRQGKGKNCRQWRLAKTKLIENELDGTKREVIISLEHFTENPFHYDVKPRDDLGKK